MFRVLIRSRLGNAVLGVLGAIYFLSASATLIYYLRSSWGAASLVDRVLQGGLIAVAVMGLFFVAAAAGNLGITSAARSRDRQGAAAGGS